MRQSLTSSSSNRLLIHFHTFCESSLPAYSILPALTFQSPWTLLSINVFSDPSHFLIVSLTLLLEHPSLVWCVFVLLLVFLKCVWLPAMSICFAEAWLVFPKGHICLPWIASGFSGEERWGVFGLYLPTFCLLEMAPCLSMNCSWLNTIPEHNA